MKQVLLSGVVSLSEHDVISVGSVHIQVYLPHLSAVLSTQHSDTKQMI